MSGKYALMDFVDIFRGKLLFGSFLNKNECC